MGRHAVRCAEWNPAGDQKASGRARDVDDIAAAANEAQPVPKPEKQPRQASSIAWPYNDLNDGAAIARAIWENVGTSTCDMAQLAAWAGHDTMDSGAFRLRVTAAKTFGLITTGSKQASLTDLGRAIVDPERAAQARVEAFLNVPLYGRLFERYDGRALPSTNIAVEADLVDLGVVAKQKDRARQVFQRSAEQAGLFAQGHNRLVRPAVRTEDVGAQRDTDSRGGSGGGSGGGGGDLDPFVQVLVRSLPEPGSVWPQSEREKWMRLASAAFDVVYKDEPTTSGAASVLQPLAERSPVDAQD